MFHHASRRTDYREIGDRKGRWRRAGDAVFVAEQLDEAVAAATAREGAPNQVGVLAKLLVVREAVGVRFRSQEAEVVAEVIEAVREEANLDAGHAAEASVGGGRSEDEGFLEVSCLSWKWRKRSAIKIMERTHEEATQALHRRGEGRRSGG